MAGGYQVNRIALTIATLFCAFVVSIIFVAIQEFFKSLIGEKLTFILGMIAGGLFVYKFIVPELTKKDD